MINIPLKLTQVNLKPEPKFFDKIRLFSILVLFNLITLIWVLINCGNFYEHREYVDIHIGRTIIDHFDCDFLQSQHFLPRADLSK